MCMAIRRFKSYGVYCAAALGIAGMALASWRLYSNPDRLLARGEQALTRGDGDKAAAYADRLDALGHSDHAHLLRGEILLARGELNPAIVEMNRIQEDDALLRMRAAGRFGLEFLKLGARPQAEQLLQYVLSKNPDHLDAQRGLAALYFDQGATMKALHHAREWTRLTPREGAGHRFMGMLYMNMLDDQLAVAEFEQALALGLPAEVRAQALLSLADVLARDNDCARSLDVLNDLDPETQREEKACELRGQCLLSEARWTELRQLLDEVLTRFPHNTRLLWLQARCLLNAEKPGEAAAALEAALRNDRHDTRCRYLLAQTYAALGRQTEQAEQLRLLKQTQDLIVELGALENRARESPWEANVRLRLGAQCDKLDRFDEAASWRQAAGACSR
jgi:predicted Zn-dependent protease